MINTALPPFQSPSSRPMFFTQELLARRDSGFGLLWLAATSGSNSSFKKLPRRSILTADIAQLCDLISEPVEPLALRLSSNLMFGVVKVYKVKQDIFFTDVSNCVVSLKRVIADLRNSGPSEAQLLLANPVAKSAAVTLALDPKSAFIFNLDGDWSAYLDETEGRSGDVEDEDEDDDNYGARPKNKKKKPSPKTVPVVENVRREAHTLEEHHEHLLSASFDLSFQHRSGEDEPSTQMDGGFDTFFPFSDAIDVGDALGDLAREIGWNVSPAKQLPTNVGRQSRPPWPHDEDLGQLGDPIPFDLGFDLPVDDALMQVDDALPGSRFATPCPSRPNKPRSGVGHGLSRQPSVAPGAETQTSFSFPSMPDVAQVQDGASVEGDARVQVSPVKRSAKRTRLLLDARTELTNEELKIARENYIQSQAGLRAELRQKKIEKDTARFVEERIWGAPAEMLAESLIDFWQENFKVQVEARTGAVQIHIEDEGPTRKRRRTRRELPERSEMGPEEGPQFQMDTYDVAALGGEADVGMMMDTDIPLFPAEDDFQYARRSSEEPGQARHASRPPSLRRIDDIARFGPGPPPAGSGSQKSQVFPWDHAGPSSSVGGVGLAGTQASLNGSHLTLDQVDTRVSRAGSLPPSRRSRGSSTGLSNRGSNFIGAAGVGAGMSPVLSARNSQGVGEDFVFDVADNAGYVPEETQQETQSSEMNALTLERNSANFLEYAKMQYQGLSNPQGYLSFENVVPQASSTRHVASAAFYHCLVLATKHLIRLEQPDPTGLINIAIL